MGAGRQAYQEVRNPLKKRSHSSRKSVRIPKKFKLFSTIHNFQNIYGLKENLSSLLAYDMFCHALEQHWFQAGLLFHLPKESGVWALDQAWQRLEAAHGKHHHFPWFWRIIFQAGKGRAGLLQMLNWCPDQGMEGNTELQYWHELPPTCLDRSGEGTQKSCMLCHPDLASSLHGFFYCSTTAESYDDGRWGVGHADEPVVSCGHNWATLMACGMAMMEEGQAALPSCLTRWERGLRSL